MPLSSGDIGLQGVTRHQRAHGNHQRASALGLGVCIALATGLEGANVQAKPKPPRIEANGGLVFQSQGGGTPNTFSGYLFAPLSQGSLGEVLFLDVVANLNLGGALVQQTNVNAGASTRLGYRWLSSDQRWMYGVNAGVDTRQAYTQYAFQAGVGAEALNRNVELRANGYIPFSNQADKYATGWTNAYLIGNQLILDGWNRYVVSLGGVNLEAGLPVARWNKDSLWLYGSYYYLGGNYVSGTSGVRGRAEVRVGSQLSVGATLSYDNLFQLQATGYVRYGAKPIAGKAGDAVAAAERNFLALRGLPMQRETDIRMINAYQDLPRSVATNPGNGGADWVVRCTGTTTNTGTANVQCANASLDAMLAAAGTNDVLLVGGGATSNLAARPLINGAPTVQLPVGTQLGASGTAPTLATQFGSANLTPIFGTTTGAQPSFSNGVVSIGSNTTIAGFAFNDASITNYSTSNVVISGNAFTGSYSPTPGINNYNQNALPTIAMIGVSNVTIAGNTFTDPNVQSYASALGTLDSPPNPPGSTGAVCARDKTPPGGPALLSGVCLSGNAIRLTNSSNYSITNNNISGALDEAIRLDNPNGTITISGNTITGMRMGPDTNIGAAIFVRQHSGSSTIYIDNNSISANEEGRNLIASGGGNSVNSGTTFRTTTYTGLTPLDNNTGNVIDGLEVGLCRGRDSFPRAEDLYGDADILDQNCNPSAPPTMNYYARSNTIIPSLSTQNQDLFNYDGIDFNIGSYSNFNAWLSGNSVTVWASGNAFTTDFRGQTSVNTTINNNTLTSRQAPIDMLVSTLSIQTPFSTGTLTINGNAMTRTSGNTAQLFEIQSESTSFTTFSVVPAYRIYAYAGDNSAPYSLSTVDAGIPNYSRGTNLPIIYFNDVKILP
jgi:hypothetical protein